jgi:predicted cupin superfamily sugar epimerase
MNEPIAPSARDVIARLGLKKHPEGGWYRETFRDPAVDANGRSRSTLIYYLLEAGETSEWHRVDATEVWLWHAGAPLVITVSENGHDASAHHLGPVLETGQRPQFVVPAGWWQTATSLGAWTLVSCTVAPAFEFSGFEMAP